MVVRQVGLEPTTLRLEGGCSIRLSYRRSVGRRGLEPRTRRLKVNCSAN